MLITLTVIILFGNGLVSAQNGDSKEIRTESASVNMTRAGPAAAESIALNSSAESDIKSNVENLTRSVEYAPRSVESVPRGGMENVSRGVKNVTLSSVDDETSSSVENITRSVENVPRSVESVALSSAEEETSSSVESLTRSVANVPRSVDNALHGAGSVIRNSVENESLSSLENEILNSAESVTLISVENASLSSSTEAGEDGSRDDDVIFELEAALDNESVRRPQDTAICYQCHTYTMPQCEAPFKNIRAIPAVYCSPGYNLCYTQFLGEREVSRDCYIPDKMLVSSTCNTDLCNNKKGDDIPVAKSRYEWRQHLRTMKYFMHGNQYPLRCVSCSSPLSARRRISENSSVVVEVEVEAPDTCYHLQPALINNMTVTCAADQVCEMVRDGRHMTRGCTYAPLDSLIVQCSGDVCNNHIDATLVEQIKARGGRLTSSVCFVGVLVCAVNIINV